MFQFKSNFTIFAKSKTIMKLPEGYNEKLRQVLEEAQKLKFSEPRKALEMANLVYVQALKSSDEQLEAAS